MTDDGAGSVDGHAAAGSTTEPPTVESTGSPPTESRPSPSRTLALIALALGIAAAVSWILSLSFWSSSIAPWVTVGLAVASVACGAVALERRDHRASAITAVVLAGAVGVFAIAGALPQPDLEAHVYGYAAPSENAPADAEAAECPALPTPPSDFDEELFYGAMYAADLANKTTAAEPVLPYDATVTLAATATEEDIMTMAAGRPIDVTEAAAGASVDPPERGRYIAVPVMYTEPRDEALACFSPAWPSSWWATESGEEIELAMVSIPGYPTLEDGGSATEDSLTYFDIFDVDPEAAASGDFVIYLLNPDLTQQAVYWGDASP